ncbi:MAG: U32 family peptidase [Clostridia bacterium]|nr:U32 family peptidase [Clostridia bacterium]
MTRPEVLSPAGSHEALEAAVQAGADAVYFGGSLFNARRAASNFSGGALADAIRFCHERGVKAYLTLNTLVFGNELKDALAFAAEACSAGADALILQDLGLAALIRSAAPDLRLHASTQLSVHNAEGVAEAARLGFKRVVLARELSFDEIALIAADAPCELEVFVHGALCMSLSGQCYMSSVLGTRSGNRGLCAQPCRLPFSAPGGTGRDLSLRDLSLITEISRLSQLGVTSLKIEGRMKRPEYVAAATAACLKAAAGEAVSQQELDDLQSVFSRSGFTKGYFEGRRGKVMFGARQYEDVVAAQHVLKGLRSLYAGERPRVTVDFSFTLKADEPARLDCRDADGNAVQTAGQVPEPACTKAVDEAFAADKLAKTGGTPFYTNGIRTQIGPGLSIPAAEINRMRREALAGLLTQRGRVRAAAFDLPTVAASVARPNGRPARKMRTIFRFHRLCQLCEAARGAAFVFVPAHELARDPAETIRLLGEGFPLAAELPRAVFGTQRQLGDELNALHAAGIGAALCGNIGQLEIARRAGLRIFGDFGLNITNEYAFEQYRALGAQGCVLSFEQTLPQLQRTASTAPEQAAMLIYGRLPLMLTRNCPIQNGTGCADCKPAVTDRTGEQFPVLCGEGEYCEILNTRPLWLCDRRAEAEQTGAGYALLYFTTETRAEAEQAAEAWEKGLPPPASFTRGLYYRGAE